MKPRRLRLAVSVPAIVTAVAAVALCNVERSSAFAFGKTHPYPFSRRTGTTIAPCPLHQISSFSLPRTVVLRRATEEPDEVTKNMEEWESIIKEEGFRSRDKSSIPPQPPQDAAAALRKAVRRTNTRVPRRQKKNDYRGLTKDSLEALASLANDPMSEVGMDRADEIINEVKEKLPEVFDDDNGGEDGDAFGPVFLDEEAYTRAGQNADISGFVRFEVPAAFQARGDIMKSFIDPPDSPVQDGYGINGGSEPTLEDLKKALDQKEEIDPETKSKLAKEMHDKVFENEEGFLKQSDIFKQSLIDQSVSDDARAWRQGKQYREEKQKAIESLEIQITEFEDMLNEHQKANSVRVCHKCKRRLAKDAKTIDVTTKDNNRAIICMPCHEKIMKKRKKKKKGKSPPPSSSSSKKK